MGPVCQSRISKAYAEIAKQIVNEAYCVVCYYDTIGYIFATKYVETIPTDLSQLRRMAALREKQPVLFLSHGAGPSFYMSGSSFKGLNKDSEAAKYFKEMVKKENLLSSCKAILVVSAHWEEETVTVQTTPRPDLYYDYGNFPPETYQLQWPAQGCPDLALRTKALLESRGITCATDGGRGYDHGVFVPLLLAFPKPQVPVFQVSLDSSLSAEKHLALGEALAALRDEGVLIIGSGFTTHRTTGGPSPPGYGKKFQNWLHDIMQNPGLNPQERRQRLTSCPQDQLVKDAHPRIEHLLPFLVVMAAAGYTQGRVLFSATVLDGEAIFEHYLFQQ